MKDVVIEGSALDILRILPDEYVQCVVTSPPYWGLRRYGGYECLWGGDEECDHDWDDVIHRARGGKNRKDNPPNVGSNLFLQTESGIRGKGFSSRICRRCGGWYGGLGQEPSPEMYVEHLVDIFSQVRRVLRSDGTCWIVIGDTYISGGDPSRHIGYSDPKYGHGRSVTYEEPQAYRHKNLKPKDMALIPQRLAIGLQEEGWYFRSEIIWSKDCPLPESMKDRPTRSHEYIFLLSKQSHYYYDYDAILEPLKWSSIVRASRGVSEANKYAEGVEGDGLVQSINQPRPNIWKMSGTKYGGDGAGLHGHSGYYDYDGRPRFNPKGRNKWTVWDIKKQNFHGNHYAVFPDEIPRICIKAGTKEGDLVMDPFCGSGTTCMVAKSLGRHWLGIDLNPEYCELSERRIQGAVMEQLDFLEEIINGKEAM